jgi:16S rRNA (cytosine1402-N4)-methyltransferase
LQPHRGGVYVDGTIGSGGHAAGILETSHPDGRLLGLDLDPAALELARVRLSVYGPRVTLVNVSFTTLEEQLTRLDWRGVDGILLDLGMSSMQLNTQSRGFSFQLDGPLDMRYNPKSGITADDLVNSLPEEEIADLILRYGEDRGARRIARAIVRARPIHSTSQLAMVVASATRRSARMPTRAKRIDPATQTFQALRIGVNQELDALQGVLPQAVAALKPHGRLAIIAFHSLEDRLVKQYFQRESRDCICPPRQPVCTCGHLATVRVITRQPITPGMAEVLENPRARSAKLRIAEKI